MSGLRLALVAIGFVTPVAAFAVADQGNSTSPTGNQTAAAAAALTLDTPIEQLVANPRARAVLDARLPGLTTHAAYETFKSMSLRQVQPYSQGMISDEALRQVETELAAIR